MKKETNGIKVAIEGHEVTITERMARALEDLPEDNFSIIRTWVAFVDTVSMNLSVSGCYKPENTNYVMETVVDMKLFLLSLTNEDYYERFQ